MGGSSACSRGKGPASSRAVKASPSYRAEGMPTIFNDRRTKPWPAASWGCTKVIVTPIWPAASPVVWGFITSRRMGGPPAAAASPPSMTEQAIARAGVRNLRNIISSSVIYVLNKIFFILCHLNFTIHKLRRWKIYTMRPARLYPLGILLRVIKHHCLALCRTFQFQQHRIRSNCIFSHITIPQNTPIAPSSQ